MALKHYKVELVTNVGVVVNDNDVSGARTLYGLIIDKAQDVIQDIDLNNRTYAVKVIAEEYEMVVK